MPPPIELIDAVKAELRSASPFPPAVIGNDLDLRIRLGLTDDLKRGLARPFQAIARDFEPTASISMDECGDLEKVRDAIELVSQKAGFEE